MIKKPFLKVILILAALSLSTGSTGGVFAQAAQDTPESVAKAYFAAMQAADWAKCASLTHPEALASMKRKFAVAINADPSGDAAKTIFKLKSGAEYSQLSEAAIFERLMDFITSIAPDMKTALASSTNTILGRVDESPDLAHVVFRSRTKMEGDEVNEVDLLSFKKQDSTWRALLTSDMEEMLNRLVDEMAPAPKEDEKNAPAGGRRPERKP
ncbi:MAG TPA: hypothetical protein VFV58_33765 [Blastocatellia bacterium]|jgi:hypothetical protein|nr:hypothetical protein [Blastocatellia bacterium]